MASKNENCLNPICESVKDLREATRMVCDHFDVKYKRSIKVCVHCLRKCLKYIKRHKKNFEATESLPFNYASYSIVKSEEDENTLNTPVDVSEQSKNINTGIKLIKENKTSKHNKNYNCKLNDITTDINKIEVMEELCSCKFSKFCLSTVKRKHKSNIHVNLSKSKQSCSNKTFLKSKTKDETKPRIAKNVFKKSSCGNGYIENVIKRINIKNTPIGDITKPIKIKNILRQTYTLPLPKIILRPKTYVIHKCNYSCVEWTDYDQNKTKKINMLAIPLYFGFKRHTTNGYGVQKSITYYETPCGVSIQNIKEMLHYLITTKSKMTIDQFDFNSFVNPLTKYHILRPIKFLDDLSEGLEFRPITCVNSINDELPPKIKYIINRQATVGVNINVDTDFLCGCDCTDNCQDKSKCACWQNTINGQDNIPDLEKNPNAGYNYRRLYENVQTGIYECNKTCKCNSLCLNRVVQQPIPNNLQLFKTEKKGWGVRCLNDIPRGTFVCCYVGNILTETNATEQGKNHGDEYLADLDFIEVVEKCKEDYEEFAFSSQLNVKSQKLSKKTIDLLNNLAMHNENLTSKNALQFLESRNLKQKYFPSNKNCYKPRKSVRNYYDNCNSMYTINAKYSGNIGRYFNHSCTPNLFVQNVFVDTHDLRFPWISYFSEQYIPAGTELTWDYGYEIGSIAGKVVDCYCDSPNCKRRLL